jgi:hypothetical protein
MKMPSREGARVQQPRSSAAPPASRASSSSPRMVRSAGSLGDGRAHVVRQSDNSCACRGGCRRRELDPFRAARERYHELHSGRVPALLRSRRSRSASGVCPTHGDDTDNARLAARNNAAAGHAIKAALKCRTGRRNRRPGSPNRWSNGFFSTGCIRRAQGTGFTCWSGLSGCRVSPAVVPSGRVQSALPSMVPIRSLV